MLQWTTAFSSTISFYTNFVSITFITANYNQSEIKIQVSGKARN